MNYNDYAFSPAFITLNFKFILYYVVQQTEHILCNLFHIYEKL